MQRQTMLLTALLVALLGSLSTGRSVAADPNVCVMVNGDTKVDKGLNNFCYADETSRAVAVRGVAVAENGSTALAVNFGFVIAENGSSAIGINHSIALAEDGSTATAVNNSEAIASGNCSVSAHNRETLNC